MPSLVALVRDVVTDAPKAIQRIALTAAGEKIERRSLGPTKGAAIKLWPDTEITTGLVVGEGLETTAAAATRVAHRGTLLQPAWALIAAGHIEAFPVLPRIEALTILVDHDANGVGQSVAEACARRWSAAGRDVIKLTPRPPGGTLPISRERGDLSMASDFVEDFVPGKRPAWQTPKFWIVDDEPPNRAPPIGNDEPARKSRATA